MSNTSAIMAAMAIAISVLGMVYFQVGLEEIGSPDDFTRIQAQVNALQNDIVLGDNAVRAISDGQDASFQSRIDSIESRILTLETAPTVDLSAGQDAGLKPVSADLELMTYADAGRNIDTKIFTRGDIINVSLYNPDGSADVIYYITDPNGVTSDPFSTNSNEGNTSFIYRIPDNAIPGKYILTVQIEEREQSLNLTINE